MSKTPEGGKGAPIAGGTVPEADGKPEEGARGGESAGGLVNWFRSIPVQAKIGLLAVVVAAAGIVANVWKDELREVLGLRSQPAPEEVRHAPAPPENRRVRFKVQMRPTPSGDAYHVADIFVNKELKASITDRRDSQLKHSEVVEESPSPDGRYNCKLSISYRVGDGANSRLGWGYQGEREMRLKDDDVLEVLPVRLKGQDIGILLNVTAGESIDAVLAELKSKDPF